MECISSKFRFPNQQHMPFFTLLNLCNIILSTKYLHDFFDTVLLGRINMLSGQILINITASHVFVQY